MGENKVKTLRIIQLDEYIRQDTRPTAKQLAKKFNMSVRTINRDLDFLRDRYNAPLANEGKGYYYTDKSFRILKVMLTEGDLFTIATIMPLMEQYKNTPLDASFKNIMEKLASMLPDQVAVDSSFLNKDVGFISDPIPKISPRVFECVFKAVKEKKVLNFEYRSLNRSEYVGKTLDVYKIICQKANWYALGYDHEVKDIRVYALSRIKNIKVTDRTFEIDSEFDLNKVIDPSFGIWCNKGPAVEYELVFVSAIKNYIIEREWHSNQQIIENEDGSVTLKFTSNQKQQVLSWVLSFGEKVKVVQPMELREKVISAAREIFRTYGVE